MEHDSEIAVSLNRTPSLSMGSALEGQEPSTAEWAAALRHAAEQGRFDVVDLGRRARRLLESTAQPEPESLF